jgi:hypothetical protein
VCSGGRAVWLGPAQRRIPAPRVAGEMLWETSDMGMEIWNGIHPPIVDSEFSLIFFIFLFFSSIFKNILHPVW